MWNSRHQYAQESVEKLPELQPIVDNDVSYKLALIINDELKMGKGKVVAQVS